MDKEISNNELILEIQNLKKEISRIKKEEDMILDSIPAWVFYKNTENVFLKVNKTFADAMKMTKEELEGKSLFDIYPKEQADAFFEDDKEVIESKIPKRNIIESIKVSDSVLWVETTKIPYEDENGKIIGVIGFTIDISEKKKIENEISKRNNELERFNNLMVGRELEMIKLKKEILDLKNKNNNA
jgi:PAS domain S-box-containing protein